MKLLNCVNYGEETVKVENVVWLSHSEGMSFRGIILPRPLPLPLSKNYSIVHCDLLAIVAESK